MQHAQLKGKLKQNLFSEIEILKNIQHPHIVGLVNILESTNHIHLVMEYCQLGDLALFVRKRDKLAAHPVTAGMMVSYPNPVGGGFNEVIVRHFAKQLASALEFLRAKNLVHRDLKPQNLLLNPPPSWLEKELPQNRPFEIHKDSFVPKTGVPSLPVLKIADFGFARHLPTTTMAETLCGSPLYMAPEILRYEKYDAKADLWSVGTVLYELMVGKPPFRAANHVDLLRKIEQTMDKIKFPVEIHISDDMKVVIRALLKKTPTERMSWENFFQAAILAEDIPGLVAADRQTRSPSVVQEGVSPLCSPLQEKRSGESLLQQQSGESQAERGAHSVSKVESRPSSLPSRHGTPPRATTLAKAPTLTSIPQARPGLSSYATAPIIQGVRADKTMAMTAMERRRSQNSPSPSFSGVPDPEERETVIKKRHERAVREAQAQAAQDIAFERDYVMIEKRAVEVNAFADELAASPHVSNLRGAVAPHPGGMVQRATAQSLPTSGASAAVTAQRATQIAFRADLPHQRRPSYERRYGPARTSASSALAAALNMVNHRLYGGTNVPPLTKAQSPPQGFGPYPAFATVQADPLVLVDGPKALPLDEDQRILSTLEERATRSDVIYGFAEVKYKQLIPFAPSSDNRMGFRKPVAHETFDEDGLTLMAVIDLSEEALVLYVRTLAILTNTMNLAHRWFNYKNRGETLAGAASFPRTSDHRTTLGTVGVCINHVVQWARNRFNECLEKSEYVSRKLISAQTRLPEYHPGYRRKHTLGNGNADFATTNITLSSGITAEKLMYDRALDLSKSAAVNELVGTDLPGCEVAYLTAIRLLDAVLENDEDPRAHAETLPGDGKDEATRAGLSEDDRIEVGDRETVVKRK